MFSGGLEGCYVGAPTSVLSEENLDEIEDFVERILGSFWHI